MIFLRFKRYFPRGLYGRVVSILILPIFFLQIVVSITFIQRHFEDVTAQMTQSMVRELQLALRLIEDAPDVMSSRQLFERDLRELGLTMIFESDLSISNEDQLRWYDLSGRVLIKSLRNYLPELGAIHLPNNRVVILYTHTVHGPIRLDFERWRVSASNPHQLLVTMVFFGILMTVIAYLYLRNQLRSITQLTDAAQAFGHGQNVEYQPSGALEVRAAGQAFLEMRDRIERHIEQHTLMLSGVGHDLRTPLTRLKLGLSLLDGPEAEKLLYDVAAMERLVNGFLSYAKGMSAEDKELIDPKALLTEVVEKAQEFGCSVKIRKLKGEGQIRLQRDSLHRVLENLISNAVRYGNSVETSMVLTESAVHFIVEDDGPGIPSNQFEEVIKPFVRLDPARNQDTGAGVGLGLAIVQQVCEAISGSLVLGTSDQLGGLKAEIIIRR